LTRFIRDRGLTFQKSGNDGLYRVFTVPVTNSVVPLPKSTFGTIEEAAQILLISLRKVLQSIYGAKSIRESSFFEFLPSESRSIFFDATSNSPHYLPQLHHPVMMDYPFLEQVGLDLVLVEEYLRESSGLPFKMLEINAGSPSGASNNMSILEGLLLEDPRVLDSLGPVLPNDHFRVLRETYESIGRSWTGKVDGVQVILPPGGANGATPEIHQLARQSGLVYSEAAQLYPDEEGWIRVRTLDGSDPTVTAIYSRVNSDSALFDLKSGIHLRDPESGAPIYCLDTLKPWESGSPVYLRDRRGRPVPLESDYAIPGALGAIHSRKLYLGGLNRLLDNKMILALLIEHAPSFARCEIERQGLSVSGVRIRPPEDLPSSSESLDRIEERPEDWVIKAPHLSGGSGVHILLSLDHQTRKRVLDEVRRSPGSFAYQKIVRIARIPVAIRASKKDSYRFANLAADIRMWAFYGSGSERPRLTHNALVRFAPEEKGPMSSIVNTSKGGGYAPFVVVDDQDCPDAISPRDLAAPLHPFKPKCTVPAFAAAQILRISDGLHEMLEDIRSGQVGGSIQFERIAALRVQMREVASFLETECSRTLQVIENLLHRILERDSTLARACSWENLQAEWVSLMPSLADSIDLDGLIRMDQLRCLDPKFLTCGISKVEYQKLREDLRQVRRFCRMRSQKDPVRKREWLRMERIIAAFARVEHHDSIPSTFLVRRLEREILKFFDSAEAGLIRSGAESLVDAFRSGKSRIRPYREPGPWSGPVGQPRYASEWEWIHQSLLVDSDFIDPQVKKIRQEWCAMVSQIQSAPEDERIERLSEARIRHFRNHPELAEMQALLGLTQNSDPELTRRVTRFLPYAAWNIDQFEQQRRIPFQQMFRLLHIQASGECFIRKKSPHGLLSQGECRIWIAIEQSPFIQGYTLGHELIHANQLHDLMRIERESLISGPDQFAAFLRDYGVYHAQIGQVRDYGCSGMANARTPLYGLPDRMVSQFFSPVIRELRFALSQSERHYEQVLTKYGNWFGFMMPSTPAVRVKALREVMPAIENLKNLIFAEECGLDLPIDPVASALPVANRIQRARFRERMYQLAREPRPGRDSLHWVASFQLYGVRFTPFEDDFPRVLPGTAPIRLGPAYNQTEQQ
jgi:uncharacterized circularly permuted ATP-grasp superfamily protein